MSSITAPTDVSTRSGDRGARRPPDLMALGRRQFGLLAAAPHPELIPLGIAAFFLFLGGVSFQLSIPGVTTIQSGPALAYLFSLVVASNWAGACWPGEGPSQRDYFLSMPVEPRLHGITRTVAGALWLLLVLLGLVIFGAVTAYTRDPGDTGGFLRPLFLAQFFLGPLAVYLMASAAALASDHPGRWITAGWMLGLVAWFMAALRHWDPVKTMMSALFLGPLRQSIPGGDDPSRTLGAIVTLLIWVGVGKVAVFLAAGKGRG